MVDWKRPAKGFEEISSVFLSSTGPDHSEEMLRNAVPSPSGSPLLYAAMCCLSPSPAVESFFACNLTVEIAKNNQTVTLIDFGFERSIVRYLMRCPNSLQDVFSHRSLVHPNYRVETTRFEGLPEITLVFPAIPRERNFPGRAVERILTEETVRKCNVILINSPMGSDEVTVSGNFNRFRKAVLFMDARDHSLAKAYSWIKRLSSGSRCFLIGAVFDEGEDSDPVLQNITKLQTTIFKHLGVGLELRVVPMPLDREARISVQTGKPLALTESSVSSSSARAIAKVCENLLRNE